VSLSGPTRIVAFARERQIHLAAPRLRRGELGIWLLSIAMMLAAVAVLGPGGVAGARPALGRMRPDAWELVLAFALAERLVVHMHFRRSAHSMSLGEIPLVFALVFTGGLEVVVTYTIGRVLVLAFLRRLPPIRLAFNFGQFALGGSIAVLTFHAIARSSAAIDPRMWVAAGVATAAASTFAVLMISLAVSLSEGRLGVEQIAASLRTDLAVTVANTSIGLCAARLIEHDWRTAVLLVVPVLGMFMTLRAFATERDRHGRLEFLYDAARALSESAAIGDALERMLARSLQAFRAESAEIVFFSPDSDDQALRVTVRAGGRVTPLAALDSTVSARLRIATAGHEQPCIANELSDPWLVDHLRGRGLADGLFTVLRGEHDCVGVMMVGGRSGVVDAFGPEDVKLFQTLATNTSVALENERLGRTVWQMTKLQGELEHQASHDSLTGLANRALFSQRLAVALDRGADEAAVIFIDVNDFKMVNDTLGHAAGDELLVAIAGRLGDCIRPVDTLARLGGDEFAVLLADRPSQDQAVEIAQRIDRRMEERFGIGGRTLGVSASIGIALGDSAGVSSEELIRNADLAMYRAKQAKTDGYELFEAGMELPVLHHHSLRERLREATSRDAFAVHYQPIVDLRTGLVTAQEALVRWPDGPRGNVAPASFIPVAEEMGVIVPIGRQILARACDDACSWDITGERAAAVHVNLSPVELCDAGFLDGVHAALDRSGLEPDRLVLEITEGVVLRDPAGCIEILQRLRELGVQIALDDFGTGYSSLSHLRGLPLDWLKIGAPFVDDIGPGGANRPFMRMILDLAASLELRVVVEGIETELQMDQLRELGCGYGQGFHLGRPAEDRPASAPSRTPASTR
jgi:diguanylate cyclase (GGDEF)-like protein